MMVIITSAIVREATTQITSGWVVNLSVIIPCLRFSRPHHLRILLRSSTSLSWGEVLIGWTLTKTFVKRERTWHVNAEAEPGTPRGRRANPATPAQFTYVYFALVGWKYRSFGVPLMNGRESDLVVMAPNEPSCRYGSNVFIKWQSCGMDALITTFCNLVE